MRDQNKRVFRAKTASRELLADPQFQEDIECRKERGLRNATIVHVAGQHEARGTSDVTRWNQMNNEENGGMEFYFPLQDWMYHWVRSSSLYSPAARQRQITVRTMFRQEEIGASVPVFGRFETGFYSRKLHSLCLSAGVPYLMDLDDLIWELPDFSTALRIPPKYLLAFPESLMSGAAAITVSTHELKEHVEHRYPGKPVFLVENCMPAWVRAATRRDDCEHRCVQDGRREYSLVY